jgi:hypothetical protein
LSISLCIYYDVPHVRSWITHLWGAWLQVDHFVLQLASNFSGHMMYGSVGSWTFFTRVAIVYIFMYLLRCIPCTSVKYSLMGCLATSGSLCSLTSQQLQRVHDVWLPWKLNIFCRARDMVFIDLWYGSREICFFFEMSSLFWSICFGFVWLYGCNLYKYCTIVCVIGKFSTLTKIFSPEISEIFIVLFLS